MFPSSPALADEINFLGMTLKVWIRKPLSEKSDYYVTVDGETIASGNTAEGAIDSAKEALE